jgi:phospholipid transport system substrate-binding protein
MKRSHAVALAIALAVAPFAARGAGAAADTPREVVEHTTQSVVDVLRDPKLPTEQKKQKIQSVVDGSMDFTTLSRLVLARNWKPLSDEQKKSFVREFKTHLTVTYSNNIESYDNETVEIVGEREEERGDWTVKTKIVRSKAQPIAVDYRVRKTDAGWKIIDVVIEGVSLVANFRSEFQDIISRNGFDGLMSSIRDKNSRGEGAKAAPKAKS